MPTLPKPSFRDIKASFEAKAHQHKHHHHVSKTPAPAPPAPTPADQTMEPVKRTTTLNPLDLIPPILTPSLPVVPKFLKTKPSWIGPTPAPRTTTLGAEAMKQRVTISYASPGLQPPVFVTTSLSDPQWEPLEMSDKQKEDGEHEFEKDFEAEEGEYQYKFRLGPGDWWTHDESKPTVDDGFGNKNNVIFVRPEGATKERKDSAEPEATPAPLMKHETFIEPEKDASPANEADEEADDCCESDEEDDQYEQVASPLFRHESIAPESMEEEQAPLFRHESIAINSQHEEPISAAASSPRSIPEEEENIDENDPTLEKFPTDEAGIAKSLERVATHLPEGTAASLSASPSSALPPSPPSVPEEAENIDENDPSIEKFPTDQEGILKSLERVATRLLEDTSIVEPHESLSRPVSSTGSDDSDKALPSVQEDEEEPAEVAKEEVRPAEPITPPMTPKVERSETVYEDSQSAREEPQEEDAAKDMPCAEETALTEETPLLSEPSQSSSEAVSANQDQKPAWFTNLWQAVLECLNLGGSPTTVTIITAAIGVGAAAYVWYGQTV